MYDLDTRGVTADDSAFIAVAPGWNVWSVWQSDDLDFSLALAGLDADRRLRIWVEDAVRNASDAEVADPLALKGSQIEILNGPPKGLKTALLKEMVPGDAMMVTMPAKLRTVRFFNRGSLAKLPWPHDSNYLVDTVYMSDITNPITSGGAPNTLAGGVTGSAVSTVSNAVKPLLLPLALVAAVWLIYEGVKNGKR